MRPKNVLPTIIRKYFKKMKGAIIMKTGKKKYVWLLVTLVVIVFVGAVMTVQVYAADESQPGKMMHHKEMMKKMAGSMDANTCKLIMGDLSSAMDAVDSASKSLDAGNTDAAKADLVKAKEHLTKVKAQMDKCMENKKMMADKAMGGEMCVNMKCPISGMTIDPMNTPEKLTRMYKGKKIGFCSPACPAAWDKLSDMEKDAKLMAAMKGE
jgi:YHS domain-containing protein